MGSLYSKQKRKTLDRITNNVVRESKKVFAADMDRKMTQMFIDLNMGVDFLEQDNIKHLRDPLDDVFTKHQFLTVRSAISDGIQEVTPDNELGLWKVLPEDHNPITTLNSIKPQLGEKRDKLAIDFMKKVKKQNAFTLKALRNLLLIDYLRVLRRSYKDLAKDWVSGESTIDDVKNMITISLGATTNEATRIFRTETTNYFNTARADYFINQTAMDYMQIFSITDGRRSMICETRHGWVFPIQEALDPAKKPAFHPHCRTVQRPLTSRLASHRRLIDIGLAMDERKFAPLPNGWAA